MNSLPLIEANIVTEAGLAILQICDASHRDGKRIIFIGNITPFDSDAAQGAITGANFRRTPIDTVLIPDTHFPPAEDFWQNLAASNQGTFELIEQ